MTYSLIGFFFDFPNEIISDDEAEEIFKEELRVKCEKKNLNYEEEYAKHVETNEANKAKKLEKETKAKENADNPDNDENHPYL